MRYRRRTLLIVLAIGPMVLAGSYWLWDALPPKPSPWYSGENIQYVPTPEFKLSREAAAMKAYRSELKAEKQQPTGNRP
jgi:hypothetical protein